MTANEIGQNNTQNHPSAGTGCRQAITTLILYAAASLFCFAFGLIYEYFGFGVTSPFMHLAFLIPLLLGFLPCLVLLLVKRNETRSLTGRMFWRLGILTLTVGSLFRGALDIYGTQSFLLMVYPFAGAFCLTAGVIAYSAASGMS